MSFFRPELFERLEAKFKWPLWLANAAGNLWFAWTIFAPVAAIVWSVFFASDGVRLERPAWIYEAKGATSDEMQLFERHEPDRGPNDFVTPAENPEIIRFDEKILAPPGDHSIATGPDWKFTAPEAGLYFIAASIGLGLDDQENKGYAVTKGLYDLSLRRLPYPGHPVYSQLIASSYHPADDPWTQVLVGMIAIKLMKNEQIDLVLTLRNQGPIKIHNSPGSAKVTINFVDPCKNQTTCG